MKRKFLSLENSVLIDVVIENEFVRFEYVLIDCMKYLFYVVCKVNYLFIGLFIGIDWKVLLVYFMEFNGIIYILF